MSYQIDLRTLKNSVDAVLDHLIEDLRRSSIEIDGKEDFYWHVPVSDLHEMSKPPSNIDVGRLTDDFDFVKLVRRGQAGDISYNLVHIAPLLRHIGEKIKS